MEADDGRRAHLDRSRRVWDRWSDHYGLSEQDFAPYREAAMDHLALSGGETVLDLGCGPGVNFGTLREAVGGTGRVVGVDLAPGMVRRARDRIEANGWANVEVVRGDGTRLPVGPERVDAAVATLSVSTMPDLPTVLAGVRDALAPGGRFVTFDIRPAPSGPARLLNPLVAPVLRRVANWNPEGDLAAALAATFETSEVVASYWGGFTFTAVSRTAGGPG